MSGVIVVLCAICVIFGYKLGKADAETQAMKNESVAGLERLKSRIVRLNTKYQKTMNELVKARRGRSARIRKGSR